MGARARLLAEGFVKQGQKLRVQACRFRGDASSANLSVAFVAISQRSNGKVQVVDVNTATRKDKRRLQSLGLDLTEHGDGNSVEVVLHGAADERTLRAAGFTYDVRIADLEARSKENAAADSKFAASSPKTQLPSGSNQYRRLADYDLELKRLAMRYPGLVKELTLNHTSVEGRDVNGIEIARTTGLVDSTRTIVVPIVNPDGFNLSREARHAGFSASFGVFDYEMKRKNCALSRATPTAPTNYAAGTCGDNLAGRLRGTDPNRNYGGLWGGSGASMHWSSDVFDWTFWTAGSLGYTFEIGPDEFHPPYNNGVVDGYLGRGQAAGAGNGGNREAYYEMLAATREQDKHSVIAGSAPAGSTLTIRKSFTTETSPVWNNPYGTNIGPARTFEDTLEYSMVTDGSRFEWNVNPSTRPTVAGRDGRDPQAPAQADFTFANPPGQPGQNTGDPRAGAHEEVSFDVGGLPDVDNGRMTVHIDWANPDTDWDLYIYDAAGNLVSQSAAFGDNTEDAMLIDPPAGRYTAVIVNYDQIESQPYDDWGNGRVDFESPRPRFENPVKEAWTFTCRRPDGQSSTPRDVVVDRGGRVEARRRLCDDCGARGIRRYLSAQKRSTAAMRPCCASASRWWRSARTSAGARWVANSVGLRSR